MRLQRVGVGLGATLGLASIMTVGLVVATEQGAGAHVKWFSNFDFRDPPRTLGEVIDVGFLALLALAAVVIGALPAVDRWLETIAPYQAVNEWLNDRRHYSIDVVRYSMAAVLLITWANEALLTPELAEPIEWVGWLEFWLAIALLSGRGNQVAGVGLFVLWAIGVYQYGAFHMLDYLHVLGIGGFLLLRGEEREEVRGLALPVLYLSVGFSLMWLGFEKLVYPEWSFAILDSRPVLRLGLPAEVFLDLAAFVEIGLGFLLIIGLLGRPLALVITIVFILTTIVFGRVEVIGHTAVHAALVVFLLHGPGRTYPAPIAIHRNLAARMSFAGVNFVLLTLLIGFLYAGAARAQFDDAVAADGPKPAPVEADDPAPDVVSVRLIDAPTGTDIEVILDGWTFVPPVDASTGAAIDVDDDAPAPTEGYGIVTVDGRTVARLDGAVAPLWSNFDDDSATLLLFSPEGRQLQVDGVPLRLTIEFDD
ncbi:MAG: DoxX family membrane protein [Actinomycetota bacterium]